MKIVCFVDDQNTLLVSFLFFI